MDTGKLDQHIPPTTKPPIAPRRRRAGYQQPGVSNCTSNDSVPSSAVLQELCNEDVLTSESDADCDGKMQSLLGKRTIDLMQQSGTLQQPECLASAVATVTTNSEVNGGVVCNSGQSADPNGNQLLGSALSPNENVVCGSLLEMRETRAYQDSLASKSDFLMGSPHVSCPVPRARSPTRDYSVDSLPPTDPPVEYRQVRVSSAVGSNLSPRVQTNLVGIQSEMSDIAVDDSFSSCSENEMVEIKDRRIKWICNWLEQRQQIGENQRLQKCGQSRRHFSQQQDHHYCFQGYPSIDNQCPPPSSQNGFRSPDPLPPAPSMASPAAYVTPSGSFPCVDQFPPNLSSLVQPSVVPVVNYITVNGPSSSSSKLPPIEKYKDYTTNGQFSDWYYEKFLPMEDQTESRLDDEISKRRVKGALQSYLDGIALQVFLNIDPSVRTLEVVESALIDAFDRNEKLRLIEMFSMMQAPKEAVAEWEARIKTHARKSDPGKYAVGHPLVESQCAEAFQGGLLTKYKTENVMTSESFNDKVYWAKHEEANERRRQQSNVKIRNVDHCSQQNQQAGVSYCQNNATAPLIQANSIGVPQTVSFFGPSTSSSGFAPDGEANFGGNHGIVHPVKFSNGVPLPRSVQLDPYWQHGGHLWTFPPNSHERGVASFGNGRTCFRCGADNHIRSNCRSWAVDPCTGMPYSDYVQSKIRPWIPKSVYRWDSSGSDISQRGYGYGPSPLGYGA